MNKPVENLSLSAGDPLPDRPEDQQLVFSPEGLSAYKISIDTNSLLEDTAEHAIVDKLMPVAVAADKKLLVARRTKAAFELREKEAGASERFRVSRAMRILESLHVHGCLLTVDDPRPLQGPLDDTAVLFAELFVKQQIKFPLCLITQSAELALQLLRNSRSAAFELSAPNVVVVYIENGRLTNWVPALRRRGEFVMHKTLGKGRKPLQLDALVSSHRIVVDTCALLEKDRRDGGALGIRFFDEMLGPLLGRCGNPMVVPRKVMLELEKHKRNPNGRNPDLARVSADAIELIDRFVKEGKAILAKDGAESPHRDRFADPELLQVGIRFQSNYKLCFITQDLALAQTLLANRAEAETGYQVTFIAQKSGELVPWESKLAHQGKSATRPETRADDRGRDSGVAGTSRPAVSAPSVSPESPAAPRRHVAAAVPDGGFAPSVRLRSLDHAPLKVNDLPQTGSSVRVDGHGRLSLGRRISEGGEGCIYETSQAQWVCKIYHASCLTRARQEKLELMVSRVVSAEGVCWPHALVRNESDEFVGYVMPRAEGSTLRQAVFGKNLLARKFPRWDREQLTQCAITVLRAVERIHALGVLIGDVNPMNFLVRDEHTVFVVDCDSFQVEGFPCPVGCETYTPPRLQGKDYSRLLRDRDDELFATTVLLFHILFPGKAPYAANGGGDIEENIVKRRFPYGRERSAGAPAGPWMFIWTHLHPALKEDFTAVFARDERIPLGVTIKHLELSLQAIRQGTAGRELFPSKPLVRGDTIEVICPSCAPGANRHEISPDLAERLKAQSRPFVCKPCQDRERLIRVSEKQIMECRAKVSPNCEGRVAVPRNHAERIEKSGQPYWCKTCSAAMKANKGLRYQQYDRTSHRTSANRSSCFVATAAYGSVDAPQVVFLRGWRDVVLRETVAGRLFIDVYYRVGPWLAWPVRRCPPLRRAVCRALDLIVVALARRHNRH